MDEDVKEEEFAPDGDPVDPNYQGILGGEKSDGSDLASAEPARYPGIAEDPYFAAQQRSLALDAAVKIGQSYDWDTDRTVTEAQKLVDFLLGK